jgi:hypothetical protein
MRQVKTWKFSTVNCEISRDRFETWQKSLEVGNTYSLKINFSWNSIAQEANEIFRKISAQASKMSQIKK